jgi:hypothetical protein
MARMALALLLALSFTLQAFVTQTHIHIGSNAVTAGFVTDAKAPGKTNPLDNEATNCLFCQEMLHSGQFSLAAAPQLALPVETGTFVSIPLALPLLLGAIPHGWQSRGPPRH